jgi:hypothetical protein
LHERLDLGRDADTLALLTDHPELDAQVGVRPSDVMTVSVWQRAPQAAECHDLGASRCQPQHCSASAANDESDAASAIQYTL